MYHQHKKFHAGDSSESTLLRRKSYTILTAYDIERRQEKDISEISTKLSVSRGQACTLLHENNWKPLSLSNKLTVHQPITKSRSEENQIITCKICFQDFRPKKMISAACDHQFCIKCWRIYVAKAIEDGHRCLVLTCPEPGCEADVDVELVESLASSHLKAKYYKYLRRSYVECSRERQWCPFPDCKYAVEFLGIGNPDVKCGSNHKFCWNCTADHHYPADCKTAAQRRKDDSCSVAWIHANTMSCPKCKRPIQKVGGCVSVRCIYPCYATFDWRVPRKKLGPKKKSWRWFWKCSA